MEIDYGSPRREIKGRKNNTKWLAAIMITLVLTTSIVGTLYIVENRSNDERVQPYPNKQTIEGQGDLYPLISQGKLLDERVLVHNEEIYVPFELFKSEIDPTLHYDQESQSVIFTTKDKVLTLQNAVLRNEVKGEETKLHIPILQIENKVYVPFSPFENIFPFTFIQHEEAVVELNALNQPKLYAGIEDNNAEENEPVFIRTKPSQKAPYVRMVNEQDKDLVIYEEKQGWYAVQTSDGIIGYVPKENTKIKGIQTEAWTREEKEFVPWNPIGQKINLTWEHVITRTPDPSNIKPPTGVNVVSPTWFHLKDENGQLKNLADKRYVDWAHQNGYQVWALLTNDFNPDLTNSVLTVYEKRRNMILQLVHYAEMYDLDGINIDFENVYLKDKENLVQFVRELTPYMHELGLVVSIDVTIKSSSETWSLFLDRKALGQIVDYMMVMTYDEHWASSPVSGSVASLPWVEKGLQGILEEVPNEKVLLGVPFYTRLWKEEIVDGKLKVSSKAYSMETIDKWLKEKNVKLSYDSASQQDYGEFVDTKEGATYKVWLENEKSMEQRVDLVHKYKLAGIASWRRGFENPAIWEVIKEGLSNPLK